MTTDSRDKFMEALRDLLEVFPYSEINVSSVCAKAGLSRRTFNRHYESLEDVARDQVRDDAVAPSDVLLDTLPLQFLSDSGQIMYSTIYQKIYEHRTFYKRIAEGLGPMWIVQAIAELSQPLNERAYSRSVIPDSEMDFAVNYFAGVSGMAIKWWVEHDFSVSPQELARLVMTWGYAYLDSLPKKSE